jgi:hypothetical protein
MTTYTEASPVTTASRSFLLGRVQPALSGLMDGSLSTLAPIFAVVLATHHPLTAGGLHRMTRIRRLQARHEPSPAENGRRWAAPAAG